MTQRRSTFCFHRNALVTMASTTTENAVTSSSPTFTVGQLVNVASRTWSGINQPGGVGRILALHHHQTPTTTTTAHVRYILDSRQEKNVELKYIQPYHIESSRLRNRNMLLGRCSRCGSLRKDCNSCDVLWADEQEEMTAPASSKQVPKKRQRTVKEEQQQQLLLSSSDDDASSSSGDSLQNYLDEQRRRERIFQRLKKQAERVLPPGKQVNAQSSRKIRKQNKQKTPKQSKQRVVVEQRSVLETLGSSPARPKEKVANHDTVSSPGTIDDSSDSEKRASDRHSRADDFGSQDASESDDMNPFFESGDDEDDDHADDDYAMLSQGFLEPDDARLLPTDIVDRTRDLAFDQLGPFIRQIIDELKREEIPSASSSLVELERRFQKASTVEEKKALLSDCESFHQGLIRNLIRQRIDQCQMAFRKLSSKRRFQRYKDSLPPGQKPCARNIEALELEFDPLNDVVSGLDARIKGLLSSLHYDVSEFDENELSGDDADESDGWTDPSSESPVKQSFGDQSPAGAAQTDDLGPLDPHPYATKKRQRKGTFVKKTGVKRIRTVSKRSKRTDRTKGGSTSMRHVSRRQSASRSSSRRTAAPTAMEEMLFDDSFGGVGPDVSAERSRSSHQLDAVSRMERFLEANEDNGYNLDASSDEDQPRPKRKPRRRRHATRDGRQSDSLSSSTSRRRSQEVKASPSDPQRGDRDDCSVLQMSLFESISKPPQTDVEEVPFHGESSGTSVHELCERLSHEYPHDSCLLVLSQVESKLEYDSLHRSDIVHVFQTVFRLLHDEEIGTLQSMVSRRGNQLEVYVRLLCLSIDILSWNDRLCPDDGLVYTICSPDRCRNFVDLVALQLVDSVYSVLLPRAWALDLQCPHAVLDKLRPICRALGRRLNLVERVSQCVLQDLPSQKWRLGLDRRVPYVSCMDAEEWFSLLATGEKTTQSKASIPRLNSFKVLPRSEVNALWSMLAFFSSIRSSEDGSAGQYRWKLLSTMLTRGVLAADKDSKSDPPSEGQIQALVKELDHLNMLLETAQFGQLPSRDKLLATMIRSSILTQSDRLCFDEAVHVATMQSMLLDKQSKRKLRSFWKTISDEWPKQSNHASEEFDLLVFAKATVSKPIGVFLLDLRPSSDAGSQCIRLLLTWFVRLPLDSGRIIRLKSAVDSVAKQLLKDSTTSVTGEVFGSKEQALNVDEFEAAFSSFSEQRQNSSTCSGAKRRELHLKEMAAYLVIVSELCSSRVSAVSVGTLCDRVWDHFANEAMRIRRESLLQGGTYSGPTCSFESDSLQLHVTAKALTFLASLVLGLSPLGMEQGLPPTQLYVFFDKMDDHASIRRIACSVIACLDCSFDTVTDSETSTWIACFVGFFFAQIRHVSAYSNECEGLLKEILTLMLPTLCRGLRKLIRRPVCGATESHCFASLLSLAVSIVRFRWTWLEFEPHSDGNRTATSDLWELLLDMIEKSVPSSRFAIDGDESSITCQGKCLVGRHTSQIATCLAALVSYDSEHRMDGLLSRFMSRSMNFESGDVSKEDETYYRHLSESLAREIVSLSTHLSPLGNQIVKHKETFAWVGLRQLLGTKVLGKLPSWNLALSNGHGDAVQRHAFSKVIDASSTSAAKSAMTVWESIVALGRLLVNAGGNSGSGFGKSLTEIERECGFEGTLMPSTIEMECFRRFRFFRELARCGQHDLCRLLATTLMNGGSEVFRLIDALFLQQKSKTDVGKSDCESATLFELLACYSETIVSIVACMLRIGSSTSDVSFLSLCDDVANKCLAPFIRNETSHVYAGLHHAVRTGRAVQAGGLIPGNGSSDYSVEAEADLGPVNGVFVACVMRRCRELILYEATSKKDGPSNSILFGLLIDRAVLGQNHDAIAFSRSFTCDSFVHPPLEDGSSRLSLAIISYLEHTEQEDVLERDQVLSLLKLKRHVMEEILIPKLRLDFESKERKVGALRLLGLMLDSEKEERTDVDVESRLSIRLVCTLAFAIRGCLLTSIAGSRVDDDLVAASFRCSAALAHLPACCVDKASVGWLIDWCKSEETAEARYLWSFFSLLNDFGNEILAGSTTSIATISDFRHTAKALKVGKGDIPGNEAVLTRRLQAILAAERSLFPEFEKRANVRNVYASRRTVTESERPLEIWVPHQSLHQPVNSLVVKMSLAEVSSV